MTDVAVAPAKTSLIALVEANPLVVLTDGEKFNSFYEEMKRETDAHVPDLTTDKGRKAIASLAFKVARTKTAIDEAGKQLNEEARAKINLVDAARRDIRERLDALRDDVRKPLTEWEAAEELREETCRTVLSELKAAGVVTLEDTSATVAGRLAELEAREIDPDVFKDMHGFAVAARDASASALAAARDRLTKEEADRRELERLRAEAAEREAHEAEERAERQRAEEEAEAARQAEAAAAQAKADEEARAERERAARESAAQEAAAAAAAEAARKAQQEREAADVAHAEQLAAEKRRADEAEAARKAETDRVNQEAEARAAREADIAHRGKIMRAAKEAIIEHGAVEDATAKAIVTAIASRLIPNVSIQF